MDVLKTFPLWKLPDVPRKLVFQKMDIQDLLDLSMTSRPVKRFLTVYKTHTIQLFWEFGENRRRSRLALMVESLDDPPTKYMRLSLHFLNVAVNNRKIYGIFNFFFVESRNVGKGIERTVNGERALRMNRRHNKEGFIVAGRENRNESDPGAPDIRFMENLSKHVKDIFFINEYILRYYASMKDFNLFDSFIWNITKTFGELSIEKEYAEVSILKIDEENIKFLFNKLNVTCMRLQVKNALSRIIPGLVLNQKYLNLYYSCNWLDMNDVINSTSQKIHVHFTRIIEVDELINLVKLWKSGEKLKNMNVLILMTIEEEEEEDDDNDDDDDDDDEEEGEAEEDVDEVEDEEVEEEINDGEDDNEENDENEKLQKEFMEKVKNLVLRPSIEKNNFTCSVQRITDGIIATLTLMNGNRFSMKIQKEEDTPMAMKKNDEEKEETFPLWKLPGLARKLVFQQMDRSDLIDLSMTSRPVKRFLTAYKTHPIQLTWKFSYFHERSRPIRFVKGISRPRRTYMTVTLTFGNDKEEENFIFYILENVSVKHDYDGVVEQDYVRTINGVKASLAMRKRRNPGEFEIGGTTSAADMKFMEDLTQHFHSIFYIDAYNVIHNASGYFDFFGLFIWNYRGNKFGKLHIDPYLGGMKCNEDQMKMIFNELEVDDLYLKLGSDCEPIHGLNLNSKKLTLKNSKFLSFDDVLDAKCEEIEITFPDRLNADDLVKTVSTWKTGEKLKNLKRLKFERDDWSREGHEEDKTAFFEKARSLGIRQRESIGNIGYIDRDTDKAVALLEYDGKEFTMILLE